MTLTQKMDTQGLEQKRPVPVARPELSDPLFVEEGSFAPVYVMPGITVSDIAAGTGLSRSGVSRIVNGERTATIENFFKITEFLSAESGRKVSLDEFKEIIRTRPWKRQAGRI